MVGAGCGGCAFGEKGRERERERGTLTLDQLSCADFVVDLMKQFTLNLTTKG